MGWVQVGFRFQVYVLFVLLLITYTTHSQYMPSTYLPSYLPTYIHTYILPQSSMKVPLRSGAPADLSHIGRQRGQAQRWTMTLLFVLVLAVAAIGAATTFSQASSPSGLSQSHARALPPPVPSLSPSFFFLPCPPFMPRV